MCLACPNKICTFEDVHLRYTWPTSHGAFVRNWDVAKLGFLDHHTVTITCPVSPSHLEASTCLRRSASSSGSNKASSFLRQRRLTQKANSEDECSLHFFALVDSIAVLLICHVSVFLFWCGWVLEPPEPNGVSIQSKQGTCGLIAGTGQRKPVCDAAQTYLWNDSQAVLLRCSSLMASGQSR